MDENSGGQSGSGGTADRQKPPWLVFLVALALAAVLLIAFGATVRSTTALVLEGLLGIAGMAGGALVGFLFGIPHAPGTRIKSDTHTQVQAGGDTPAPKNGGTPAPTNGDTPAPTNGDTPAPTNGDTAASTATQVTAAVADPGYEPSTNLEQVSDWLTKIIIGVGLVEFGKIGNALAELGEVVSGSLGNRAPAGVAVVSQIALVLFAILGFGASYLWTRIYYGEIQTLSDRRVRDLLKPVLASFTQTLERQEAKLDEQKSDVQETRDLARVVAQGPLPRQGSARDGADAERVKAPPRELAWPQEVRDRLDSFMAEPVDWNTDPTRDHFGSVPAASNGRALTARIVSNLGKSLVISASVVRIGERALEGTVTFVLHPTFPDRAITVPARGDVAEVVFAAREWFTIAAITDDGQTVLSLSLKDLEGAPGWFTGTGAQ